MYFYRAYGLVIESVVPLPELIPTSETCADVTIRRGKIARSPHEVDMPLYQFHATEQHPTEQDVYFAWQQAGVFLARGSQEIIFDVDSNIDLDIIRFPLLGMALAVILYQRGYLIMHASSINVNGKAVAFVGKKGMGKSTTSAALYTQGYDLIADDIVAIDLNGSGTPMVIPGFPQFKLWAESAIAIGDDPATLPRLAAGYEKRSRRADDRFATAPIPLHRIYVLAEGETLQIQPLQPQASVFHMVANSHIARIAEPMLRGTQGISHFRHCMRLIEQVPVCQLERPRSLALLSEITQAVTADVMGDRVQVTNL
jgi:hypothetical protein